MHINILKIPYINAFIYLDWILHTLMAQKISHFINKNYQFIFKKCFTIDSNLLIPTEFFPIKKL